MREELEALVADYLDGSIDAEGRERLARELGKDPAARAEFADQLEIHHRLGVTLESSNPEFVDAVVREVKLLDDADRFSQGVVRQIKQTTSRRRIWEMAAAALFLIVAGWALFRPATPTTPAAAPRQVLFVVGHAPLDTGDRAVLERLEKQGYRVTAKAEAAVTEADARGATFVAISSTALVRDVLSVPGELMTKFRSLAVPILTWEPRLFYDLGMLPGAVHHTDWAATKNLSTVSIVTPAHPLAGGLSGRVVLTTAPAQLSWGRAREEAIRIATLEGSPEKSAVFAYDRGASMPGLVAPARRVGFFLFDKTALQLTPQGWALFDAAVRWCSER
jgi:anti-sigma factor RsiW